MRHNHPKYRNRFAEAMIHTTHYSFAGKARLARDCGLSKMSIQRLISGDHNPSYRVVHLVVAALERALGRRLDARELISYDGEYERPICAVCGCSGCLPEEALREDGARNPAYANVAPGQWMEFEASERQSTPSICIENEQVLYRKEDA